MNRPTAEGGTSARPLVSSALSVALSVAIGFPLIRVFVAVLYGVRERSGTPAAIGIAAAAFAAPIMWAAVRRVVGPPVARGAAMAGLAVASIGVQFVHPIPWWLAGAGVACALGSWTLLLHDARAGAPGAPPGGSSFAMGLVLGLGIDIGVHASLRTWDAAWQGAAVARVFTVSLALASAVNIALLSAAARRAGREARTGESRMRAVMPIAALGPFLVLQTLFLHNVAFVDAAANVTIPVGSVAVLAGLASTSVALAATPKTWTSPVARITMSAALGFIAWMLPVARGSVVLVAVAVASVLSSILLSIALEPRTQAHHPGAWRTAVAVTIGTLTFAGFVLAFQLHASTPLPFSDRWLPAGAAVLLGAATLGAKSEPWAVQGAVHTGPARLAAVPLTLAVAIPLLFVLARPEGSSIRGEASAPEGSVRIMSWNVHAAVDADGQVVPETFARAIAAQRADVVVLQEVSRGWPIGGTLDLAEWLSARLGLPYVWADAADTRFGNVVLSGSPIVGAEAVALPFGSGPQQRSLVRVTLDVEGSIVTVVGTHLETGPGTDTRARQIDVVLDAVAGQPRTIVAGDMNMQPADADVARFVDAGFLSAQDEAGNSASSTAREPDFPGDRPDWIFGSGDLTFSRFAIVRSDASDHRPLVVTASW